MQLGAHYDFEGLGSLMPRNNQGAVLTCDRAGEAVIVDRFGQMQFVDSDVPRMYGGVVSENLWPLADPSASVGDWSVTGNLQNSAFAPPEGYGLNNVVELDYDFAADVPFGYEPGATLTDLTPGRTYLLSCFVKRDDGQKPIQASSSGGTGDFCFNIQNTIGTAAFEGHGAYESSDGWWRCWGVVRAVSTTGNTGIIQYEAQKNFSGNAIHACGFTLEDVTGRWNKENLMQYSDEFGPAGTVGNWTYQTGAVLLDAFAEGPGVHGLTRSHHIDIGSAGGNKGVFKASAYTGIGFAEKYFVSVWIKGNNADTLRIANPSASSDVQTVEVTTEWQRLWVLLESRSTAMGVWFMHLGNTLTEIYVAGLQLERARPNQTEPTAYQHTSGSRFSDYRPSNFILTSTAAIQQATGPCQGSYVGLGVWDSYTNLLLRSQEFDQAPWTTVGLNLTVTPDTVTAPDGTVTGDQLTDDATLGVHSVRQALTVTDATSYVLGVWARGYAQGIEEICLFESSSNSGKFFDLANGTITGFLTNDTDDAGIVPWGNGWYFCWIAITTVGISMSWRVYTSDGTQTVSYTGAGDSCYVWGGMLVEGVQPIPYIRTFGTPITKDADDIFTLDLGWYGSAVQEETWYVRWQPDWFDEDTLQNNAFCIYQSGTNHRRHLINGTGGRTGEAMVQMRDGVDIGETNMGNTYAPGVFPGEKHAIVFTTEADNNVIMAADGVLDPTGLVSHNVAPLTPTNFRVGTFTTGAGTYADGLIQEIRMYHGRAPVESLAPMTRPASEGPPIFPGYDSKQAAKQKAIDAALWNKAMNARTREARSESEEDYVPYNNIG
jgi:hypothetical protein